MTFLDLFPTKKPTSFLSGFGTPATPTTAPGNLAPNAFASFAPTIGTVANSTPSQTVAPGASLFQDFAAGAVRAPIRAGATLVETGKQAVTNQPESVQPSGFLSNFLLGKEPVQSLQTNIKDTQGGLEAAGLPSSIAKPFGAFTAVGSLALDLTPLGGEENVLKQIAQIKDVTAAERLARQIGVAEDLLPTARDAFLKANTTADAKRALESITTLQSTTKRVADNSPRAAADAYSVAADSSKAKVSENLPELVDRYLKENGNVVNTDAARELFPEYQADRSLSAAVHEPASTVSKAAYDTLLETRKGAGAGDGANSVLFTMGGTGAGKTSGLAASGINPQDFAIVYDTNLAKLEGAVAKIEKALQNGYSVLVNYTHADISEALSRALDRASRMEAAKGSGRTVPLSEHIATHLGAARTFPQLVEKYGDRVQFQMADNVHGEGATAITDPLAFLKEKGYTKDYETGLEEKLHSTIDLARRDGRISEKTAQGFREGTSRAGVRQADRRIEAGSQKAPGGLAPTAERGVSPREKTGGTPDTPPNTPSTELQPGRTNLQSSPAETAPTPLKSSYLKATTEDVKSLATAVDSGVNVDHLSISPEGKKFIEDTTAEVMPQLEEALGKTLSNKEALTFAESSGKVFSRAVGREQTLAWESAMLATRQKLAALAETGTADRNYIDTLLTVKTLGTDLARKLQSLSISAEPGLKSQKQTIIEAVLKVTDDADAVVAAAKDVDFTDFKQASEFYRHFIAPQKREWLDLLRYNSMLSSPKTHIINAFSNAINTTIVAATEKIVVGQIDFLRSAITGGARTRLTGEAGAMLKGYFSHVGEASTRFGDVLAGRKAMTNLDTKHIPLAVSGFPAKVEQALSFPLKLLEASDQFFTALSEGGERASVNYLASKGIKVPLAEKHIQDAAAYRLFRQDLHADGQGSVLDAIDSLTSLLMQAREAKNPIVSTVARFTVPFIKTPINILKQGIEYSPLGFSTLIHAKDKQTQLARALIGSSIFAGGALLLTSGRLTWSEPTNAAEKNAFRDAGMQPYSVKIGNDWVSYQKLPPALSFPLSMIALLHESMESGKADAGLVDHILTSIAGVGQFLADQSYAKSIGDLLSAAKGGESGLAQLLSNDVQQLVPYRALGGWLTRLIDQVQRQPDANTPLIKKEVEYMMAQIPGLSTKVPARENAQGEAIKQQHPILNAFSPLNVSTEDPGKAQGYDQAQNIQALEKQSSADSKAVKMKAEEEWGQLKDLPKEEIKAQLKSLAQTDPALVKKVLSIAADEKAGLSYAERQLKGATIETRAQFISSQKATFKTDAQWKAYLKDLAAKKILTSDVLARMLELKRGSAGDIIK